jgi:hypothetical protein
MQIKFVRIVTLGFIQRNYVDNTTAMRKSPGFVIEYTSSKVPFCWEFQPGYHHSWVSLFFVFFVFFHLKYKRLACGRAAYLVV